MELSERTKLVINLESIRVYAKTDGPKILGLLI